MKSKIIYSDFEVTAVTQCGEELIRTKINPNKRHSKNNTIIAWNLYESGKYKYTFWRKPNK